MGGHLHNLKRVMLQVILTAPVDKLVNLLSVCKLVIVLYQTAVSSVNFRDFTDDSPEVQSLV